jgi:dipeptidyl-peptidase-4
MYHRKLLLLLTLLLFYSFNSFSQNSPPAENKHHKRVYANMLDANRASAQLAGESGPANVNWINDGKRFSYIKRVDNKQQIWVNDPQTGQDELIFDPDSIYIPGTNTPFTFGSFQWSLNSKFILFRSNFRAVWRRTGIADYYFYSLADKTLKLVAKDAQTAEISPDGTKVGFETGGNLFVFDFKSDITTQLTFDAKDYFYNGRFGWVYAEEFGLPKAWLWSPDGRSIAFWQTDERSVPLSQFTDFTGQHSYFSIIPYPKVGDPIPLVKVGVINVDNKRITWTNIDVGDGYIPRIYWTSVPEVLGVVHLNRKQNQLRLFFCNISNGNAKPIMEESSESWIDVFNYAGTNHFFFFPDNKKEFFWVSDRDGWNHIFKFDYNGKLLKQITKGNWEVSRIEAINEKTETIYFSSTEKSPLERYLYSIDFNGNNKTTLTNSPGMHRFNVSPDGVYYIDSYSTVTTPLRVELRSTKNNTIKVLEDNAKVYDYLATHFYSPSELFNFTTSDGAKLDGYIVKPKDFDPAKKYPLLLNIYGGPLVQFVYNQFSNDGFEQYLAQQGYVIVNVNNRGCTGYGRDFAKIIYGSIGKYASNDFVETVKYMSSFPWIDVDKIGIKGISFGGYISSYTMLKYPGIFKVALVSAAITDLTLYDATYTERYMGLLAENKDGYKNNSPVTLVDNLKGKMLLVHSGADDNVHFQNSMQLLTEFIEKGKDIDLRIFPKGGHGVAYNEISRALLNAQYLDYLNRYLKGDDSTHETDKINTDPSEW